MNTELITQVSAFLWQEADMLDHGEYAPWLESWTPDGLYIVPIDPLETALIGNLNNYGTITTYGDNSVGIRSTAAITGNVTVDGSVSANGAGASAVSVGNDVSGRVTVQGSLTSSGYRYRSLGTDAFVAKLDADDLLQGGSTVVVAGDVGGGLVFDAPPTASTTNTDVDGDGRLDSAEGTASVTSFGSAAAVTVGSASRAVNLGVAGTGDAAYGFINKGSIVGNGVYAGVNSNALALGVAGGQSVNIAGGVRNDGTLATLANGSNATTVRVGSGVTTPTILNNGFITAAT